MSSETYSYKGISAGKYIEGEIEAINQEEASFKLKEQNSTKDEIRHYHSLGLLPPEAHRPVKCVGLLKAPKAPSYPLSLREESKKK